MNSMNFIVIGLASFSSPNAARIPSRKTWFEGAAPLTLRVGPPLEVRTRGSHWLLEHFWIQNRSKTDVGDPFKPLKGLRKAF